MKSKIFVILQSVFLGLGLLAVTTPVNPADAGKPGNPSPAEVALGITPAVPNLLKPGQSPGEAASRVGMHHQLVRR